jgi:hypothetical protein
MEMAKAAAMEMATATAKVSESIRGSSRMRADRNSKLIITDWEAEGYLGIRQ